MTFSGFIATLIALALAVLAMRLARRGPAPPPDARRPKPGARKAGSGDAPSRPEGGETPRPTPQKKPGRENKKAVSIPAKERQPVADAVFKVYSAEDDEENAKPKRSAATVKSPESRPKSEDWS